MKSVAFPIAGRTRTANRTRPRPAAASVAPPTDATGSCNILEQCRPGQRVRLPSAPQEIARSFITFLRFSVVARTLASLVPSSSSFSSPTSSSSCAGSPRTRRARPTSAPTDLSHFPLLRDADVMKRASLTCVLRLENWSLNSQDIPRTFIDKSS